MGRRNKRKQKSQKKDQAETPKTADSVKAKSAGTSNTIEHTWEPKSESESESDNQITQNFHPGVYLLAALVLWTLGYFLLKLWSEDRQSALDTRLSFIFANFARSEDSEMDLIWTRFYVSAVVLSMGIAMLLLINWGSIFALKFWSIHVTPLNKTGSVLMSCFQQSQVSNLVTIVPLVGLTLFAELQGLKERNNPQILRVFKISIYILVLRSIGTFGHFWTHRNYLSSVFDLSVIVLLGQLAFLGQGAGQNWVMVV